MTQGPTPNDGEHVDINEPGALARWAKKLDVTSEQVKDAVGAVGDRAADVEMHLKGTRSTTNADQEERGEQIDERNGRA